MRHRWLALVPLLTGTFLGTVSNNIVNVPLRAIGDEFGVPVSRCVLVVVGFTLTFAVSMPLAGWLADRFGRRRVYCGAVGALAAASVGAAVAPTLDVLVGFRVAQGLATAAVLPSVMGMITDMFPEGQRGRALGWWAGANGLGQAIGPTFGGVVAQFASWRWVFVPIAPLALLALVATVRLVPPDQKAGPAVALEWRGALSLTAGAALVVAAAVAVAQPAVILAGVLAGLGVGLLGLFTVFSRRAQVPFVSPQLVREPSYLRSSLAAFAQMFCLGATLVGAALYLTGSGGTPPAVAGAVVLALPAAMALLAPISGLLTDRAGARLVIRAGLVVLILAQSWLIFVLGARRGVAEIAAALVLTGVAVALVQTPAALGATRSGAGRAGPGLGLFNLIRFSGSATGAAWVAVALGRAGTFATMFAVCAVVAAAGLAGTFAGPNPPRVAPAPVDTPRPDRGPRPAARR